MDKNILKYVPKSKMESIHDAWRDEDGYWIMLREGWNADRTDNKCRTIHEDDIKGIRYQIGGIARV